MKPHDGGGWKNVYRVENADDLFAKHEETGQLVMMLQEEIVFEEYFRVYCLGQKYVHIMPYDPRRPFHERYVKDYEPNAEQKRILKIVHDYTLKLNKSLGYDFNTVEFAIRDGVPYAIDFCNPAPDADINSVGQANFDWIVEHSAKYAIEKANAHKAKQNNTSWGTFVKNSVTPVAPKRGRVNLKTAAEAKKTSVKTAISPAKKATAQKTKTAIVKKVGSVTKAPAKPKIAATKKARTKTTAKPTAKPKTTAVKKAATKAKTTTKTKSTSKKTK